MPHAVACAYERRNSTLLVEISGHPGTGRRTLAAALRARFRLSCVVRIGQDPSDGDVRPDLEIRVIGASPRARDHEAAGHEAAEHADRPRIVVAGKADVRTDAQRLADDAANELGVTVHPVSGLLAGAIAGPADLERLCTPDADTASVGPALVRRFGLAGVTAARKFLDGDPDASARAVTAHLHRISGLDALVVPIRAVSADVGRMRDARLIADLRLIAALGDGRDAAERELAARIGGPR